MTTAGVLTEYATSANDTKPYEICAGPDGALWFTEEKSVMIGRMTTAGMLTEYSTSASDTEPACICEGPDSALWVTENHANQISRMAVTFSSTTILTTSSNPAVYGQSVTFTATVSGTSGTPTGSVVFVEGILPVALVALSNGTATFTTTLPGGTHSIEAAYLGDSVYIGSLSSTLSETVTPVSLTVTARAATKTYGAAVPTLTYTYSGLVNGDTSQCLLGKPGDDGLGGVERRHLSDHARTPSPPDRTTRSHSPAARSPSPRLRSS